MIKLRQSEIDRACNGWTVITRPQNDGGVMVSTINIHDQSIWMTNIVRNGNVHDEIRGQLRMMDKCGFDVPMADHARHRPGKKILKQQLDK